MSTPALVLIFAASAAAIWAAGTVLGRTTDVLDRRLGIGSAIAYLLGAAIPLSVTVAAPVAVESWLILAAVVVSLIVTSGIGARTAHTNLRRTLARTLTIGLATMAVSYLVGKLVF